MLRSSKGVVDVAVTVERDTHGDNRGAVETVANTKSIAAVILI